MFSPCFPNNFPNIKTYMGYSFFDDIGKIGNTFALLIRGDTHTCTPQCVCLYPYMYVSKKSPNFPNMPQKPIWDIAFYVGKTHWERRF